MTDQHPITPPPKLVQQWINEEDGLTAGHIATQAARWGADQELEACCGFIGCEHSVAWSSKFRAARRPKPPTLKEQALGLLNEGPVSDLQDHEVATIRRALETLPND